MAHRLSYEVYRGSIPPGALVLHKCDNPRCTNPAHLFIGTHLDNMRDVSKKQRNRKSRNRGAKNPNAKLTAEKARRIFKAPGTYKAIAEANKVSAALVSLIKNKKIWTHSL